MAYAKAVAASLTNINVSSPGASIDGVPLNNGDRVLLTRQTTPSQNGVWVFDTDITVMSRPGAPDQYQNGVSFDNATIIWVTGGDTLGGTVWGIDPATRVTVGTTSHNLTRVSLPPVHCRAATIENIDLTATTTTIDGVALVGNGQAGSDIILLKDQIDPVENGLYWAHTGGALTGKRCNEPLVPTRRVLVSEGDRNGHTRHELVTKGAISPDATALTFSPQNLVVNVCDFGGRADGKLVNDASVVNADATVTTPVARFTADDKNKLIRISEADADRAPLFSTVDLVTSATSIELADPAAQTLDNLLAVLWRTDNEEAIRNAVDAIPETGGSLFFPGPGVYAVATAVTIPSHVEVVFDRGAMLVSAGATITIEGPVTHHPLSQVFGGAGVTDAVDGDARLTVRGDPYSAYTIIVTITETGPLGPAGPCAKFTFSVNGNPDLTYDALSKNTNTQAEFPIPGTGLTLQFDNDTYTEDTSWTITTHAPLVLGPRAFEHADIMTFGALQDVDDTITQIVNTRAINFGLGALRAAGNAATSIVTRGKFYFDTTLSLCQTVVLRGTGRTEPADTAGGGGSVPGTWFLFPPGIDGIHLFSTYRAQGGADYTQIRDLTIVVDDPPVDVAYAGNGVRINAPATLSHVTVESFGGHGIFVSAGTKPPADPGLAGGFLLDTCTVGKCRGDGFQTVGSDANVGTIINCNASVNRGFGFRDRTIINTYVGCHSALNQGLDTGDEDEDPVKNRNYAAWGVPADGSPRIHRADSSLFLRI